MEKPSCSGLTAFPISKHSGKRNAEVRLYAFDLLFDDGVDVRDETLHIRSYGFANCRSGLPIGIIFNERAMGEIGPLLFRQACLMGLEGIVSKRQDNSYKAGPSRHWIKVKNPKSAAMVRAKEGEPRRFGKRLRSLMRHRRSSSAPNFAIRAASLPRNFAEVIRHRAGLPEITFTDAS